MMRRLLVACALLAMAAVSDACVDRRLTRKCLVKIQRKGMARKCGKARFAAKCAASCGLCGNPVPQGVPVPGINNACGCTEYRGVTASSTSACTKNEYINGAPGVICIP